MVDPRDILKFTDEIARQFRPQKIVLFGSYAYGQPTEDSDVDLLVVKPYRGESFREAIQIDAALERNFPLDLLVRTSAELLRRAAMDDWFLREVVDQGIVLYDAKDEGVSRKGRRRLQRRAPITLITTSGAT